MGFSSVVVVLVWFGFGFFFLVEFVCKQWWLAIDSYFYLVSMWETSNGLVTTESIQNLLVFLKKLARNQWKIYFFLWGMGAENFCVRQVSRKAAAVCLHISSFVPVCSAADSADLQFGGRQTWIQILLQSSLVWLTETHLIFLPFSFLKVGTAFPADVSVSPVRCLSFSPSPSFLLSSLFLPPFLSLSFSLLSNIS